MYSVLYILLLQCFCCFARNAQSLYFIHNVKNDEYYCITNSSYGLTWIDQSQKAHKSTFLSASESKSFEWIFKDENLNKFHSTSISVQATILDRRWEELDIYKFTNFHQSRTFFIKENNFILPFSVKTGGAVYLYLCGSNKRPCYVLSLSRAPTAQKCERDDLIKCKNITSSFGVGSKHLGKDVWTHFELTQFDKNITLQLLNGTYKTKVLQFEDAKPIEIKQIFAYGRRIDFCKFHVHKPDFYITQEIHEKQFGPTINSDFFCLNFFTTMCSSCQLKITFAVAENLNKIEEIYLSEKSTYSEWKEVKIVRKNITGNVVVLLSTISESGNDDIFWAIDKARFCQVNEFRYISSKKRQSCQLVVDNQKIIASDQQLALSSHGVNCPEKTTGNSCIPCFWNSSCDAVKIYEETKQDGKNVNFECSEGFYGGFCIPKCNISVSRNETCSSSNAKKVFAQSLRIGTIRETEVLIYLDQNFFNQDLLFYCIEYKKMEEVPWMKSCLVGEANFTTIQNLNPDCYYVVRRVVITSTGRKFESSTTTFRTKPVVNYLDLNAIFSNVYFLVLFILLLLLIIIVVFTWVRYYQSWKSKYKKLTESTDLKNSNKLYNESIPFKILDNSNLIPVTSFEQHVRACLERGDFEREHKSLLQGSNTVTNNTKFHYDHVKFQNRDGTTAQFYIVSVMPTPETYSKFWKMIWNEKVQNIIFLNTVSTKDLPDLCYVVPDRTKYHGITVRLQACQPFSHYEQRIYVLSCHKQQQQVTQLCYTITDTFGLKAFLHTLSKTPANANSPIVISSSSGFQTTGFAVLCDVTLRRALKDGYVDFVQTAKTLTECRADLCDDTQLYILAHLVVLESIGNFETKVHLETMTSENMNQHFAHLQRTLWLDQAVKLMKQKIGHSKPQNEHVYTVVDRVKPVVVDGYQSSMKFYVVQAPTKFNLNHFWKTVASKQITKIVALQLSPENKFLVGLPSENQPHFSISKTVTLTFKKTMALKNYVWESVELTSPTTNFTLDIFLVKEEVYSNIYDFTNFCLDSKVILKTSDSTLVTCSDGLTASGLFLAILYNIEMAKKEGSCDICSSVRTLRSYHPSFIKNENQFNFLWRAVKYYLKESDLYQR